MLCLSFYFGCGTCVPGTCCCIARLFVVHRLLHCVACFDEAPPIARSRSSHTRHNTPYTGPPPLPQVNSVLSAYGIPTMNEKSDFTSVYVQLPDEAGQRTLCAFSYPKYWVEVSRNSPSYDRCNTGRIFGSRSPCALPNYSVVDLTSSTLQRPFPLSVRGIIRYQVSPA